MWVWARAAHLAGSINNDSNLASTDLLQKNAALLDPVVLWTISHTLPQEIVMLWRSSGGTQSGA
jgi:hypothetical protein